TALFPALSSVIPFVESTAAPVAAGAARECLPEATTSAADAVADITTVPPAPKPSMQLMSRGNMLIGNAIVLSAFVGLLGGPALALWGITQLDHPAARTSVPAITAVIAGASLAVLTIGLFIFNPSFLANRRFRAKAV